MTTARQTWNPSPAERQRYFELRANVESERESILSNGREAKRKPGDLVCLVLAALHAARVEQGLSLSELQKKSGMNRSSLSCLLNDPSSNPTLLRLQRIAEVCGKRLVVTLEDSLE